VLLNPAAELSEISLGGYKELFSMGVDYRWAYPTFYKENTPWVMWANRYQELVFRVVDSARLFARGYLGPNATVDGSVYVLNNSDPRSVANSLAASDLCPAFSDPAGGKNATIWNNIYLPPIVDRVAKLVPGINFTTTDVSIFGYLCGFETQITGRRSPWCDTLTEEEFLQYEYAQDIRYWYGDGGLGTTGVGRYMMLPFLTDLVSVFVNGPNASYTNSNSSTPFTPPQLIATFTNDGQVDQLASAIGVFDDQPQLPATYVPANRTFRSSYFDTMRGTITFERLNCDCGIFMRIKLNDQVYPVRYCKSGPGQSCPLKQYQSIIANKSAAFGDFEVACGIANTSAVPIGQDKTTFLTNLDLPFEYVVKP
jgi:acid phosphatase